MVSNNNTLLLLSIARESIRQRYSLSYRYVSTIPQNELIGLDYLPHDENRTGLKNIYDVAGEYGYIKGRVAFFKQVLNAHGDCFACCRCISRLIAASSAHDLDVIANILINPL